jgi:hypothetical protein
MKSILKTARKSIMPINLLLILSLTGLSANCYSQNLKTAQKPVVSNMVTKSAGLLQQKNIKAVALYKALTQQKKKMAKATRGINKLIKKKKPGKLSKAESKEFDEHKKWLVKVETRISAHYAKLGKFLKQNKGGNLGIMAEMKQMNMQFLNLQQVLQNQSRQYQTLSNAIKASHQAASNSIRNMK